MQRSQKRRLQLPQQGQMQPIRVTVDHIEITGSRGKLVEEYGMRAHWLPVPAAQAQAARDYRHKLSARDRITTREQGHVVPEIDQLLGEPCDDPLGPPIKVRRNAFSERSNLGDSQRGLSEWLNAARWPLKVARRFSYSCICNVETVPV